MTKIFLLLFCMLWATISRAQQDTILSARDMQADLSIVKAAFTQLHPGVYRYVTPTELNQYFAETERQIDKPLTIRQFYIKLSQLAVRLHCGHTYVNPYNQKKSIANLVFSDKVFPLLFKIIRGRFIVTHNLSANPEIKPDDEILSVNGIRSKAIIDSLLTVSRADGMHGLEKQLDNINLTQNFVNARSFALFDIYFPLFFPSNFNAEQYKLVIKPLNGKPVCLTIASLNKSKRQQMFEQKFVSEATEPTCDFRLLTPNSGYLKIKTFSNRGWKTEYRNYLDSLFSRLQIEHTQNLVVDIRENEGGDDEVRNEVISYLLKQSLVYSIQRYYRFLTVPQSLLPYLETWDNTFKKPKDANNYMRADNGLFFKKGTPPFDTIQAKMNHFKGQVYLLIGAINSSSSYFMADMLKQAKAARLVGEPTGGTKQGINGGQFFFLMLPHTGLEVDIPLIWQTAPIKRADEGIQPDILIKVQQKDILYQNDPALTYLTKLF